MLLPLLFFSFFFFFFFFLLLLLLVTSASSSPPSSSALVASAASFSEAHPSKISKGTEDPKTPPKKGQKNLLPPVFGANMSHVTISPPRLQCKNYATRVPPRVSRSSGHQLQSKTHVPPEKRGGKRGKKWEPNHGCLTEPQNVAAKIGSIFSKKNAFRTTFSHVSCNWGQNLGFF